MLIEKMPAFSAVALGAALLLAACGGSSGSKASTSKTSTTARSTSANALQKCLKSHGVDLPTGFSGGRPPGAQSSQGGQGSQGSQGSQGTPPSLPAGVDLQKLQSALQACGGTFGGGGGAAGPNSQAFQAYTSCLRDHGVNVPQQGASNQTPPTFDRSSAAYSAANKVCGALLPSSPSSTSAP